MKIKVGVFFGGNSVEHEISVITMNQAIKITGVPLSPEPLVTCSTGIFKINR